MLGGMATEGGLDANASASGTKSVLVDISSADHAFDAGLRPKGFLVEGTGNLVLGYADESTDTFNSVPAYTQLNVSAAKVVRTGTTATRIHAIF